MKSIKTLIAVLASLFITAMAHAGDLALDGYCPVCYIAAGKAVKGEKQFSADQGKSTYYFVSAETRDMFKANPDKFLPQYEGYCVYGVANGKKLKSDPTVFAVVDGKTYLNYDKKIAEKFNEDQKGFIKKADEMWPKVKGM